MIGLLRPGRSTRDQPKARPGRGRRAAVAVLGMLAVPLAAAGVTAVTAAAATTYAVTATIPLGWSPVGVGVDPATNTVYVATPGTGVSVIDEATNTVTATIGIADTPNGGSNPYGVGVDPATDTVYVANHTGNSVSVIDGATNTVTATIGGLPGEPQAVGVDPATDTVYVSSDGSNTVSVIDGATNTITATIGVGAMPQAVAVDPATDTVYIANAFSDSVSVIDGATNTVTATIGVGAIPRDVAVDPATHTLYVANSGAPGTVSVIDEATNTVTATIDTGNAPFHVGVDPSTNTIYVALESNPGIGVSVIDGATNTITATIGGLSGGLQGVAVDPATHTVYVPSGVGITGWVSVITPSAAATTTSLSVSPGGTAFAGDTVTLTAIETPATAGTVQFFDGTSPLGSPVMVSAGTAAYATSSLTAGSHSLAAVFTPSSSAFAGSTSPPAALQVIPPPFDRTVTVTGTGTVTTPPFSTTAAGETLLAFAGSDGPFGAHKQTVTVSGAGLTWTLVKRANAQAGDAEIWQATAPGVLTGATVTSKQAKRGYDQDLTVVAVEGTGGIGASGNASASSGGPALSLTTTGNNSLVFAVGDDWDNAVPRTLPTGWTQLNQWLDTATADTYWSQYTSAPIAQAGTIVSVGDTAPTSDRWNLAAVEVTSSTG